jgi:hypothetical protein
MSVMRPLPVTVVEDSIRSGRKRTVVIRLSHTVLRLVAVRTSSPGCRASSTTIWP